MGFLDKLLKRSNPIENPAVSLSSPAALNWLFGSRPSASGELVSEINSLEIVTVARCVNILASTVACLPLKVYATAANGRSEATDAPLYDLLMVAANPEMTSFTWKECMVGCLALTGNAYSQIQRNPAGQPIALWPLHPHKTEPVRMGDGSLMYSTSDGETNGRVRYIAANDVIHLLLWSMDGLKGLSPVMMAKQTLGAQKAATKFGAKWFGNGSRPGGILSTPSTSMDEQNLLSLRESFESNNGGENQGRMAFLTGEWKYSALSVNPEESQFLQTLQHNRTEIAAIWGIPGHMVGDVSRLSNSNHEQQQLSFITDVIAPYLARIEAEIVKKLVPTIGRNAGRISVQFDISARTRGDAATTMKALQTGVLTGWISRNEARAVLGLNPGPDDLNTFIVPVNEQNSARLLDTESLQDQPLTTDEPVPVTDDTTQQERSALDQYRSAYLRLFADGVARTIKRDKRDLPALQTIFDPTLRSILDASEASAKSKLGHDLDLSEASDRTLKDCIKSLEKRAAAWTSETTSEAIAVEFSKVVRSIHTNTYREAAAALALKDTQ